MRLPVNKPYTISTKFGVDTDTAAFGRHAGEDYAVPTGRQVFAPVSGIVTDYTSGKYHGLTVQIFDGTLYHRMMHNSRLLVRPGTRVSEGQLVAESGATGQNVSGPHVHYDITPQKVPTYFSFIDPNSLLGKEANMQPITPSELNDMCGALWGVQADPNHHKNWDGKPFYEVWKATHGDPRTFEYADKCYKAIHNPQGFELVKDELYKKKG